MITRRHLLSLTGGVLIAGVPRAASAQSNTTTVTFVVEGMT